MVRTISVPTSGRGLVDISERVESIVMQASRPEGLCTVFVRHTSASLLIQENADPAVLADLEHWLAKWVVDGDPLFTHRAEGPDDMAAHIRSALTQTSITVPYTNHQLMLGTWQGIYLWEHRYAPHTRELAIHVAE
ncbi:MAG: secondary thiamine-phosphate synthase enzyme YjbQ [Pseudomonadota bacterium]|nr:secondary thiamine-phosphate synthase enzyme YjbQ [Pseudomonadota bacterium]